MKRVLSMVLSIAMMLSMVCVSHAASGGVVSANVDGAASKGETVDVDINFDSNPGFWMGTIQLVYDEALTYVSSEDTGLFGDTMNDMVVAHNESKHLIQLKWENDETALVTNTGTAAVLTFQVPADASSKDIYAITFQSVKMADTSAKKVEFTSTDCEITVNAANGYPIRATVGENGSISPSGDTSVERGEDITYTITANEGYHVESIKVDTVAVEFEKSSVVKYTLTNVTRAHTIEVTFAAHEPVGDNGNCDDVVTCAGCVDILKSATEHVWDEGTVTQEPTCTEAGTKHYVCTVGTCSGNKDEEIAVTGHHYETVVTAPTCTEQGYTTYTCVDGDDTYVDDYVDALGHNWDLGTVTTAPTCTEAGVMTYTCLNGCGETYTSEIAATGHRYETVVTAPTCTKQGYTTYTCVDGDDTYVSDYVNATGHNWDLGVVTTAPTCTEAGVMTYTCLNGCGETKDSEIAATGHTLTTTVTKEPTCTEAGEKIASCENCDYVEEPVAIEAKGHSYTAVVTAPTCTAEGYTTYTCDCGDTYVADKVAATGHSYQSGICTTCGAKKPTGGGSSGSGGGGSSVAEECTLTFNTNGGTAVAAVTKYAGTTIKLANYTTTKPGYTFAGWYTDKTLTNSVTSVKLNDDMTVYAKWIAKDQNNASKLPFTDVDGHWAKDAIAYAYNAGIMSGMSATEFGPDNALTRAMVVTILYSMEGRPAVTSENPFADVAESAYYADAVTWAAKNGVVAGVGEGEFAPDALITREQLATIMRAYAELKGQDVSGRADLTSFTDEETISSWAVENMKWAVARGIISGMDTGALAPQGTTTRAQCAQIMYSFLEK